MRPRLLLLAPIAAGCAACNADPQAASQAVPPATTDTNLAAPVNAAAEDATAIPVVPDPPAR